MIAGALPDFVHLFGFVCSDLVVDETGSKDHEIRSLGTPPPGTQPPWTDKIGMGVTFSHFKVVPTTTYLAKKLQP